MHKLVIEESRNETEQGTVYVLMRATCSECGKLPGAMWYLERSFVERSFERHIKFDVNPQIHHNTKSI